MKVEDNIDANKATDCAQSICDALLNCITIKYEQKHQLKLNGSKHIKREEEWKQLLVKYLVQNCEWKYLLSLCIETKRIDNIAIAMLQLNNNPRRVFKSSMKKNTNLFGIDQEFKKKPNEFIQPFLYILKNQIDLYCNELQSRNDQSDFNPIIEEVNHQSVGLVISPNEGCHEEKIRDFDPLHVDVAEEIQSVGLITSLNQDFQEEQMDPIYVELSSKIKTKESQSHSMKGCEMKCDEILENATEINQKTVNKSVSDVQIVTERKDDRKGSSSLSPLFNHSKELVLIETSPSSKPISTTHSSSIHDPILPISRTSPTDVHSIQDIDMLSIYIAEEVILRSKVLISEGYDVPSHDVNMENQFMKAFSHHLKVSQKSLLHSCLRCYPLIRAFIEELVVEFKVRYQFFLSKEATFELNTQFLKIGRGLFTEIINEVKKPLKKEEYFAHDDDSRLVIK